MNAEMEVHGIKCDNPTCDYNDMSVKLEEYPEWVNKPCPKCGENLLKEEDYKMVLDMLAATEILNMYTLEEIKNIEASMTPEEIDSSLDFINSAGLKKTGVDEQGRDIWTRQ